jgi:hypothetical protein
MYHHPVSPRHTTLHGTTASQWHRSCHDVVLEHTFACRSPYQHCSQIVGLCSAARSSTEPWFTTVWPTAQRTVLHRASAGPQQHMSPLPFLRARHTRKFHSCCFVDYVFQRKSPRRWAWRCRRKQLTHVQRISLAGVVSRATCIGAGRAANRAALCVCIDWGCICKGRVVWPRSGRRDLFRTARLSNKGCVAVPRGHVGSCKEGLYGTIASNWRFWAGLFLKWVC